MVADVLAPRSLLLNPELPATAKLVWMLQSSAPGDVNRIAAVSGLTRTTVRKGLDVLAAAGWGTPAGPAVAGSGAGTPANPVVAGSGAGTPANPVVAGSGAEQQEDPLVTVPGALLTDRSVSAQARVLYAILQAHFPGPAVRITYPSLAALTGLAVNTLKRSGSQLSAAGWLRTVRTSRLAPVRFTLTNPPRARQEAEELAARQRIEEAPFRGEALMREFLSLLIDSEEYEDDAAPGFLVNPLTDERMQFDRFYSPRVVFEFNGPQHYGPTELYPSTAKASFQRARDLIKLGICAERGISLVVIHLEDLSLEGMRRKIGALLPLRDLAGHELLTEFLSMAGSVHRSGGRPLPEVKRMVDESSG